MTRIWGEKVNGRLRIAFRRLHDGNDPAQAGGFFLSKIVRVKKVAAVQRPYRFWLPTAPVTCW